MPDWLYGVLPSGTAGLRLLATVPGVLSYREPEPGLETELLGVEFSSPLVMGVEVDPEGSAWKATSRLGFGAMIVSQSRTSRRGHSPRSIISLDELPDQFPVADGYLIPPAGLEWSEVPTGAVYVRGGDDVEKLAESCVERGWGLFLRATDDEVSRLRAKFPELVMMVEGGSQSPAQVLALRESGADQVVLGTELLEVGPALVSRANEALYARARRLPVHEPPERLAWFWGLILGLSMLVGSMMAGSISLTQVMLPYDEEFCGLTAAEISSFNEKILSFMTHDRFTLACTMVSLGLLYVMLSLKEIKRGSLWAQRAVTLSAVGGFVTFFSFLGFGYFDPLHALVTAILFQMMVQICVRPAGPPQPRSQVCLHNDAAWRRARWGQLLFVLHGLALMAAGSVILGFGMTRVFVPEDLAFLQTDAATITAFDPQLMPLIAHDRATFGGMLVSAGLALLLATMWGFRRGDRWLWWTYLVVILTPYLGTLWVHYSIGYVDLFHLAPVFIGIGLWLGGAILSGPYLLRDSILPPAESPDRC